jgi:hypothetical protein
VSCIDYKTHEKPPCQLSRATDKQSQIRAIPDWERSQQISVGLAGHRPITRSTSKTFQFLRSPLGGLAHASAIPINTAPSLLSQSTLTLSNSFTADSSTRRYTHQTCYPRLWSAQRQFAPRLRPRSLYVSKLHLLPSTDIFSTLVRLLLSATKSRLLLSFELPFEPPQATAHSQLPHRTQLEILPLAGGESLRQGPQRCIGADLKPP